MCSLHEKFAQAQAEVNQLSTRPNNEILLKLYALYKQATEGDVTGERPSGFDLVRTAKFDAWQKMKGTSVGAAMHQYIELVSSLK